MPITFGSPHPTVSIVQQDGKFRIRELVVDPEEAKAAAEASRRARSPSWMPEHFYALGKPIGKIFAEAATRAELIELMTKMTWPTDW